MHTAVIGGGAAGMAAAIAAAERGRRVTVLERNRRPLKKLGVTGNGRGNVLNSGEPVYYGGREFALRVLDAVPYARLLSFFDALGVSLTEEAEGRVYPAALHAGVVVDALNLRAAALGVRVLPGVRVVSLCRASGNGFSMEAVESVYGEPGRKKGRKDAGPLVEERPFRLEADRVIVAAGGAAAPAHGTDGGGYSLLTAFGHSLTPLRPALCALRTDPAPLAGLSGQRVRARLTLLDEAGQPVHETRGEALFAEDGVSGIAAMQLARFGSHGCTLRMDLREALMGVRASGGDALSWLLRRSGVRRAMPLSELLTGAASPAVAKAILRAAGLETLSRPIGTLGASDWKAVAGAIEAFSLPVLGTRGFGAAQVTAGGISTSEFNPGTMESRLVPGLYAAGEVLDVDGDCGGHNLAFAFASGLLAGASG